jgi:hypothetical protein
MHSTPRAVVDIQRARADKTEAKPSAIPALVTMPGIPRAPLAHPQPLPPRCGELARPRVDNHRPGTDGLFGVTVMPWKTTEFAGTATPASRSHIGAENAQRICAESRVNPNSKYTICCHENTRKVQQ